MNAGIYARVSKKQEEGSVDESDSSKKQESDSPKKQVEAARTFITARGWQLDERHVYTDDGVSGALFANRSEYQRMMRDASSGEFDLLVLFDLDRLGRDGHKTMGALNTLADLGITIYDSSTGRMIEIDSFENRLPTILKTEFAQQFREQVRKHTTTTMHRKFLEGYVMGGKVYGYDNVKVGGYKRREINEEQAAVVREIYDRYARGEGYKSIAWELNRRKVPAPRAQLGRPCGWATGTIRAVLDRSVYRGTETYGRSRKAYGRELGKRRLKHDGSEREKGQLPKAKETWLTYESPALRIVNPAVAAAVDARRGDRESRYLRSMNGQLIGRPSPGAKYLLSGLLRCPCGAGMEALKGGNWSHAGAVYVCGARRRKGPSVCPHNLELPIQQTDDTILSVIEDSILHPDYYEAVVLESVFAKREPDKREKLEQERARLRREVENLTVGIALGRDIPSLVNSLKDREKRLRHIDARLVEIAPVERNALRDALRQRVADWRTILRTNVAQARIVLQQLVAMPLTLHTEHDRPRWVGRPRPDGLLVGMVPTVASPSGFEPEFWP